MTVPRFIAHPRGFWRDQAGASLVEYTVVIILFLLVFFAILDFGRLGFNWVMTEKAMQRAARIAVTRPPVCAGVPESHTRLGSSTEPYGTLCRAGGVCTDPGIQQCVLSAAAIDCSTQLPDLTGGPSAAAIAARNSAQTAQEIWCLLEPILPSNATPQNIRLAYSFDPNLGFVGGPYVPMVEVAVATADNVTGGNNVIANAQELRFEFITPIPALAAMAGGAATSNFEDDDSNSLADIPFPDLSVSMPGEDLNRGTNG